MKPDCLECWAMYCITVRTVTVCRWCADIASRAVAIPHVPTKVEREREKSKARRKAMVAA